MPEVSDGRQDRHGQDQDGHQVQPAASDREVTSTDVKYAIERCFLPQVANGYASVYFGDIEGAEGAGQDGQGDLRHRDARRHDARLQAHEGPARVARAARSACRCSVPVPKEYAQKYDEDKPSTYGQHQVFTGPYMIENDGKGKVTGYEAGKTHRPRPQPELGPVDRLPAGLLRQDRASRPATTTPTSRRARSLDGQSMLSGDYAPAGAVAEAGSCRRNKDQLSRRRRAAATATSR